MFHAGLRPFIWAFLVGDAFHIPGFRIARRVQKALQVAGIRQNECRIVAIEARRLVDRFPWRDVVGRAADDIGRVVDLGHVDFIVANRQRAGVEERIGVDHVDEVVMQPHRQAGRVAVSCLC